MSVDTFDVEVQQKIVALMVKDRAFMLKCLDHIKPHYFDSEVLIDLSRMSLDYFKKYHTNFSSTSLLDTIQAFLQTNKRDNPEEYFTVIGEMYKDSIPERDYLIDKVTEFVLFQEVRNALCESADLLRLKDFDKIKKLVDKAYKIKQESTLGIDFFEPEAILDRHSKTETEKVSTGLPELDRCLGGGLGKGELGIILMPPNVGKSIVLTILGANGLRNRLKVLHITLEMADYKVALRYDRNLLGKGKQVIADDLDGTVSFLTQFAKNLKANLHIKQWPTKSASIHAIKAYLEQLKGEGFEPDLMLVDYSAIMKASVPRERRDLEIEECNEDLRGLAGELNIPVWTAAQTKASGVSKAILTIEDFGESFAQSKVADVVIAGCQTKSEYENDILRFFMAKVRDDKKHQILQYSTNFDVMRIQYESSGT